MSYKALYRTYRPLTFGEIAGQRAIVRTLQNALNQNKIAHAYLFSGPRGTGKTTMAKLFAKALNCEEGLGHQCNRCTNCNSVNDGSHPDVYEIDAASNNGVEDVRQLIENINYAPIRGRYKVYIIDEVHMMTQSAFNALLKTLEEPPQNVIFILATTEPHKVIPTILSRCQRYNFSKVSDRDITKRLKTVLETEVIPYEEEALKLLVSLADGGVRDALSMLDQVLAYSRQQLKLEDVLALFALTSKLEQLNLLRAVASSNVEEVFTILSGLIDKGVDVRRLTTDLLNLLKDALIYYRTENTDLLNYLRKEEVQELNMMFEIENLNMMIENLLKAQADYRFASDVKNIFEITLLKIITSLNQDIMVEKELIIQKPKVKTAPSVPKKNEKHAIVTETEKETIVEEQELPPFMTQSREKLEKRVTETKSEIVKDEVKTAQPVPEKVQYANPLHNEGQVIELDDDTIIKILTLADRDEKLSLRNNRWDDLALMAMDSVVGEHANVLLNGAPYALAPEIILVEFNFDQYARYINILENQKIMQDIIERLVGRRIPVYGLTHGQAVSFARKYRSMSQIQKLPRVKSVKEELEGKFDYV